MHGSCSRTRRGSLAPLAGNADQRSASKPVSNFKHQILFARMRCPAVCCERLQREGRGRGIARVDWLCWLPSSTGSRRRNAKSVDAARQPPRPFNRRPRTRRSFHSSAVGVAGGVQAAARSTLSRQPRSPWISSPLGRSFTPAYAGTEPRAWPHRKGPVFCLVGQDCSTLERIAAAPLNRGADCPPAVTMHAVSATSAGVG